MTPAAYQAAWRAKNKERDLLLKKRWLDANPDFRLEVQRRYRLAHAETIRASDAQRRKTDSWKAYMAAKCRERQAMKLHATPAWAQSEFEKLAIKEMYALARQRSNFTGAKWHVDHIVPLNSEFVCGLHCSANLQVIPGVENVRKGNRTWPNQP